ncbi:MAG TPA: alpha-galactosidase [Trebonia sp.]|nr:alpha-galactosidase [Trebonia sp.]
MSQVMYDEQARTWLLRTPHSAYGLGVSADGSSVRHLHWGGPIDQEDLRALVATPADGAAERVSWGEEDPVEFVAWGGLRFDEPSLKVDFADGTRAIEWRYSDYRITEEDGCHTLVVEMRDHSYPLAVEFCYRIFDDNDVIERWALLRHGGDRGLIVVRQAYSANWCLPRDHGWRLRYLQGGHLVETRLTEATLHPGKFVLESRRGTTSHQANPWFALDRGGLATEEHGEVWSGALAWSGSWKLVVEVTPGGQLHVTGGYNEFDSPFEMAPGTELVLPVFAGVYGHHGMGGISRKWHSYQLRHVLSRRGRAGGSPSFPALGGHSESASAAPPVRPVLYNSWEATEFKVDEPSQARLAEVAAEMGVELFVVDDGWFTGRVNDRAGLGDWITDPAKFPHGLDPLIERVEKLGMRFGLWVEPEMVNADSMLYREHPDWVFHFPNRRRSEKRNQLVLNLGRRDVADWVHASIDRLVSEHSISFLKWDMNRHFSEPGWPAETGRNPERAWIDHTRNLYEILDRLRADHPGLEIESCSGGGGRVDLGILSRTDQVWPSDNTDASDRITIQDGFTHAYAPMTMMCWVTDSPNPITGRRLPLSYRFHVAMAGSLGIGGDLLAWPEEEQAEAADLVAAYKAIRPLVQYGRLYRLARSWQETVTASQYLAEDGAELAVLAWWRPRSFGVWGTRLRLAALDAGARYRDAATGEVYGGGMLMHSGLPLPASLEYGSMLVHLIRI